jgi:hypothetical protein
MINQDVLNLNTFCEKQTNAVLNNIKIEDKQSIAACGDMMGIVSNPTMADTEYPLIADKITTKEGYIKAKTAKNFKILKAMRNLKDKLENIVLLKKEGSPNITLFNTNLDNAQSIEEVQDDQKYPEYQNFIPTRTPILKVTLDINLLKTMVDYLAKFDTRDNPVVDISLYGSEDAIKFECIIPDTKEFTGIMMPMEQPKSEEKTESTEGVIA